METPITKELNDRINKHKDRQFKEAITNRPQSFYYMWKQASNQNPRYNTITEQWETRDA